MNIPILLFDGQTSNGNGAWFTGTGGIYDVVVEGDLDGGTITLETAHDLAAASPQEVFAEGTKVEINAAANYVVEIRLKSALSIRAVLTGATSPNCTVKLV